MPLESKRESTEILLVDDDPSILETLAAILEDEFSVKTATSVREGLRALQSGSFDVLVTDYDLGDGTGETLLRWATQNAKGPVAGILLTGHPDYGEVRRLQREVEFLVLFKPVDPQSLITWVRHEVTLARLKRSVNRMQKRP